MSIYDERLLTGERLTDIDNAEALIADYLRRSVSGHYVSRTHLRQLAGALAGANEEIRRLRMINAGAKEREEDQ